jgi:hypothetical protein
VVLRHYEDMTETDTTEINLLAKLNEWPFVPDEFLVFGRYLDERGD